MIARTVMHVNLSAQTSQSAVMRTTSEELHLSNEDHLHQETQTLKVKPRNMVLSETPGLLKTASWPKTT